MSDHTPPPGEKPGWFDKQSNINLLMYMLYAACAIVAVLGFFFYNHHPHFPGVEEGTFMGVVWGRVFFAFWGFVCFGGIVLLGQHLRKLVMRDEDYYDR